MYADDTQAMQVVDPNDLSHQTKQLHSLQNGIEVVSDWMSANKLKLNEEKTEFLVIGCRHQLKKVAINSITISGAVIPKSSKARNLGVIVDEQLNMSAHVNQICKSCYANLQNLYKIRPFLTKSATKKLVHATIISKLDYCNTLLYGLPGYLLKKLT